MATTESTIAPSSTVEQAAIVQNTPLKTSSIYSVESVENYAEATPSSSVEQVSPTPNSTEQSVPQNHVPANQAQPTAPSSSETGTLTLQPGEGPKQVAERAGITVDQPFALNGMDPNNYALYPGQELRVK